VNNRPYYIAESKIYAVWFDGKKWIIGFFSQLHENGKITYGVMHQVLDYQALDCPSNVTVWPEWFGGKWEENINAKLFCEINYFQENTD